MEVDRNVFHYRLVHALSDRRLLLDRAAGFVQFVRWCFILSAVFVVVCDSYISPTVGSVFPVVLVDDRTTRLSSIMFFTDTFHPSKLNSSTELPGHWPGKNDDHLSYTHWIFFYFHTKHFVVNIWNSVVIVTWFLFRWLRTRMLHRQRQPSRMRRNRRRRRTRRTTERRKHRSGVECLLRTLKKTNIRE